MIFPTFPLDKSGRVSFNTTDMCIVNKNNHNLKRTIVTSASNGSLSFKGGGLSLKSINKIYDYARGKINPHLAKKSVNAAAIERLAERVRRKHPYLMKFLSNKTFQKAMTTMNNNQLLSDAGIALFYTCFMRPLSIASLPAKDKNEK